MARVFRRPLSATARRAPTRVAKRKAQKHKVIMESVTQEKKKLRSVISFETKAPPGYTFISAGNPKVTNACKELCRKDGLKIFAVTTTPHMRTHNLSQHVHRIGFHFPSAVVATVCMDLGLSLTATGNVVPIHGVGGYTRHQDPDKSQMSQIAINTEARDVLKDLFPNIPDNDLNQIIKTSFQMGHRKVGTALELPLARRAQLAVVAHIRHVYTDYDRLLKVTSFHEARSVVEEPTLAKLVAWRGDDENGKTVLEDVFREVIVISDDDDDDDDSDEGENVPLTNNRELSVEYVSSQARTVELPTRMVTYTNPASRECLRELSEDEAPQSFRVIPEVPRKNKIDRRGFSRYEAWDRAINRYRNVTNGADQNRFHGGSTDRQRPFYSMRQPPYGSVNVSTEPRHQVVSSQMASAAPPNQMRDHHVSAQKAPTVPLIGSSYGNWAQKESSCNILTSHVSPKVRPMPPLPGPSRQRNPDIVRLPDIVPLERAAPPLRNGHMPVRQYDSSAPVLNDPQGFRDDKEAQFGYQPRTMAPSDNKGSNAQDRALPSIENPSSPKEIRRPGSGRLDHLSRRISGGLSIRSVTPQRLPHQENPQQDIGERRDDDQFPKRRRVAYRGSIHGDSHPGIAPGAVDSAVPTILKEPPGGKRYIPYGYVPSGQPSQDDSHVRRKYVTPVDPHFAGRWPERVQNPSVHAAHANTSSNIPVDGRRIDDRVAHPAHHHSFFTLDDNSQRPVLYSSDSRVPRTYHGDPNHSVDDLRSRHMPEQRILSWQNQDDERLISSQDFSQRRNFYADDFVRPVGLHETRPLEYTMQRPHIQAQRAPEIIPHTQGPRVYDGKHNREEPVDTRSSMTYHGGRQPWLDYRAAPHSHEYAILDDKDRTMRDNRLFESSFVPRHYEKRHEGILDSTRSMAIQPQYGLQTQDRHQPTYVRRVRQPEPPHPAPDGRTVVIVD